MITYLTSHIGGHYKIDGKRIPTKLFADNGFLDSLKKRWKDNTNILIIGANANDIERNDNIRDVLACKFRMNGTPVTLQRCEGFASSVCQAFTPAY